MALQPYSKSEVYMYNAGILKRYDNDHIKLIQMRALRLPGFEERGADGKGRKGSAGNTAKLNESLSRSRSKVFELAMANPWQHFVTLTVNGASYDRYNLNEVYGAISKWINNINYTRNKNIKYLLVPEPHKDSAWHFHGLMLGLDDNELCAFDFSSRLPLYIKSKITHGEPVFNWPRYAEKFGWVIVEPIRNHEACAGYMTKYITKELQHSSIALNHHIYYSSKNLKRAEELYRGELRQNIEQPDFENEYIRTKNFSDISEAIKYFCDKES